MTKPLIEPGILAALKAKIGLFTSLLAGLVPASGGGTSNFLRADGTWAAPGGGGGGSGATDAVIVASFDGLGAALVVGSKCYVTVAQACTITAVRMLADVSGSVVVDVWKDTYANYPATIADTITASAKPTITSALKSEDATLTGWTTSVAAGDTLVFNIDSCSAITKLHIQLKATRP